MAELSFPRPLRLGEAAKLMSVAKKTLYNEHRKGNLRCAMIGGALCTDDSALRDWWNRKCQERSCPPASICESGPAANLSSSSRMTGQNIQPDAALMIAKGLRNG